MPIKRSVWLLLIVVALISSTNVRAHADTSECSGSHGPSTYQAQPGDVANKTHLSLERAFDGRGHFEVNLCAGELRVVRAPASGKLELEVTLESSGSQPVSSYVHAVDVDSDKAVIDLRTPKSVHAEVTLRVPSSDDLHSEINVGAGKVVLHGDGIAGDRELNLGYGNATIYLAGDHNYSALEANVGMGSFHDHRSGGGSSHFVISKDMEGEGKGRLEINVGAGSIDLEPAED
ncbi:MAG: hypothetical protein ACR2JE_12170 [Acidobacteriaceae bacterium]